MYTGNDATLAPMGTSREVQALLSRIMCTRVPRVYRAYSNLLLNRVRRVWVRTFFFFTAIGVCEEFSKITLCALCQPRTVCGVAIKSAKLTFLEGKIDFRHNDIGIRRERHRFI